MKTLPAMAFALAALLFTGTLPAQVPQLINYQGRVAVGTVNFDGCSQLLTPDQRIASPPANAVTLTVTKGLYSVLLGDGTLANMTTVPATVFTNAECRADDHYAPSLTCGGQRGPSDWCGRGRMEDRAKRRSEYFYEREFADLFSGWAREQPELEICCVILRWHQAGRDR